MLDEFGNISIISINITTKASSKHTVNRFPKERDINSITTDIKQEMTFSMSIKVEQTIDSQESQIDDIQVS
jgi:hypothetical protein